MGPRFREDDSGRGAPREYSRRPDIPHEAIELGAEPRAFASERLRRAQYFARGLAGLGGAAIDLHAIAGRVALLLDRRRNRRGYAGDWRNRRADGLDRVDRFLSRILHARDVTGNLL